MKGTSWGGVKTLNSLMKCVAVPQLPRNVELSMSKWLGLKRQNWPVCGQASVFVTRTGRTFGYVHDGHTLLKTDSTPPLLFVQPVGVQCKHFCDTFPTTCANYFDLFLMPKCGCIWYHAPFSGWEKCFVVADAGMTPTSLFVWFKWCFYNGFCHCFFCLLYVCHDTFWYIFTYMAWKCSHDQCNCTAIIVLSRFVLDWLQTHSCQQRGKTTEALIVTSCNQRL